MGEDRFLPDEWDKLSFMVGTQLNSYYCDMVRKWDF